MGRKLAVEILLIAAIGLALAALGPFGSYAVPFGTRAAWWIGFILAGYAIFRPLLVVAGWLDERLRIGRFAAQLLVLAIGAVPLSLLIDLFLDRMLAPGTSRFPLLYGQVLGIGIVVGFLMDRLLGTPASTSPPAEAAAPSPLRLRFLARLPPTIGPRLLCLSMEDHYVRAHGDLGSALILMRLRDAIAELDGLPGLQVHRSWWVAADAVERVERDGARLRLRLANGLLVPVARSQEGAVKAQNWPQG
ncbi:MAG TPA: LytTR family DNA-binding domain-containing protein [Allosphingosinicella sp.]